jgi:alkyl sulfatase BDS1-like metallo-beta-lactamase superfamily hydrolase
VGFNGLPDFCASQKNPKMQNFKTLTKIFILTGNSACGFGKSLSSQSRLNNKNELYKITDRVIFEFG